MKRTMTLLLVLAAIASAAGEVTAQVTYEDILGAADDPGNWLTYNGTYLSQRHSQLSQITADNVDDIIAEVAAARQTERGTRADDRRSETAMEDRKKQGYF